MVALDEENMNWTSLLIELYVPYEDMMRPKFWGNKEFKEEMGNLPKNLKTKFKQYLSQRHM